MPRTGPPKAPPSDPVAVHPSSGNVFADLGLADAEERLAKAELARVIRAAIRDRGLTQAAAADLMGIRQPDVSDLVLGKLARFSRSRLERCLILLGYEIRIRIGPRSGNGKAGIEVETVESF